MISIAMATYNGQEYLEQQLLSILNQSCQPDEVIICDDCSTDNTCEIIGSFISKHQLTTWRLIQNKKNLGFVSNFMQAVFQTHYEIILLCDQDDIWLPNKIERMSQVMSENNDILTLSSQYSCIDAEGKPILRPKQKSKKSGALQKIKFASFVHMRTYPGMSMAIRRDFALKCCALASQTELLAHDWFFNLVAAQQNKMYYMYEVLALYRLHGSNTIGLGANNISYDLNYRILALEKQKDICQKAENALKLLPENEFFVASQICLVDKIKDTYRLRAKALIDKRLITCIGLIFRLPYYRDFLAWVGDIAYLLGFHRMSG